MENSPLIIRPATLHDTAQIATLHALCFGRADAYVGPWKEADFREMIKSSNYRGYKANTIKIDRIEVS